MFVREGDEIIINYRFLLWILLILILLLILIYTVYKLSRRLPKAFARRKEKNIMRISALLRMKVYTSDGLEIGKVIDVLLGENKIDKLKIKSIRKISKKLKRKGIILNYRHVRNVGDIVVIDERVTDTI